VNVYPFIEAEKRGRRNVTRACELLKVSRAAFYAYLSRPSRTCVADQSSDHALQANWAIPPDA
jgi:putative transposase